jgi:hypothetical protein
MLAFMRSSGVSGFEVLALQGTSEELVARQIFGRNDAHFDILVTPV